MNFRQTYTHKRQQFSDVHVYPSPSQRSIFRIFDHIYFVLPDINPRAYEFKVRCINEKLGALI